MTTKNMMYDHPAYIAVIPQPTGSITGAAGVGTKYAAFTALVIKSVTLAATTVGTSADVISVLKVATGSGTNTSTTTVTYGTMGSAAFFGNFTPAVATNQITCNQGDTFWVQKGTDATAVFVGQIETVVVPLSNVTV
jgi:hypothetical protein